MTNELKTQPSAADGRGPEHQAPALSPDTVQLQAEGFAWKDVMVRLPRDFALNDLNNPGIWRLIQADARVSLERHDRVYLVSHGEEWAATAIVGGATRTGASLAGLRRIELEQRNQRIAGDELYDIVWAGNGYVVQRKADGHTMTNPAPNVEAARRDLDRLYPRPVTGRL